jgi:hypothetical protein
MSTGSATVRSIENLLTLCILSTIFTRTLGSSHTARTTQCVGTLLGTVNLASSHGFIKAFILNNLMAYFDRLGTTLRLLTEYSYTIGAVSASSLF